MDRDEHTGPVHRATTAEGLPHLADVDDDRSRDDVLLSAGSGLMVQMGGPAGSAPADVLVGRGARVLCPAGLVGHVDHVLVDPDTDAVRALVVRQGPLLATDVLVPVDWVETVTAEEIVIGADRARLAHLPAYRLAHSDI
jgi:hypothetical protein